MRSYLLLFLLACTTVHAATPGGDPARLSQLIDYVGVDYPEAVADGEIVNAAEYEEMVEFAAAIRMETEQLPADLREPLLPMAEQLGELISDRADPGQIADLTREMREILLESPALATIPERIPDVAAAAALYQQQCALCHGETGRGNGPAGRGLEPAPTDFTDVTRAEARTVYGLYNTITLGVDETGMQAYGHLDAEQRWALAFYVSALHATPQQVEDGERAFGELELIERPELRELTTRALGDIDTARADIHRYLRHQPRALEQDTSPLAIAVAGITQARNVYREGDRDTAYAAAVDAYLEGFELIEASLAATDRQLMIRVERAMTRLRQQIREGEAVPVVTVSADEVLALLNETRQQMEGATLSRSVAFSSALFIILREGLEAILVLGAIAAFLVTTGHRNALPWLHAGWIAALAAGGLTWVVSEYLLRISGATRELTEGVTALLAAGILFYVGFWMHSKLHAGRWQQFIRERIQQALDTRALGAITLIAFIAVYREVFETVLFFQALWTQVDAQGSSAVTAGFLAGSLCVVIAAWGIFRFGIRLPLKQFFAVSAAVMIVLSIIFAGNGIAALQEAGTLPVSTLDFNPIDWLGIYPSIQAIAAQVLLATAAIALIVYNGRRTASSES